MVVGEFDLMRMAVDPREAETPLLVHANAVLSGSITAELLQSVAQRDTEIVESERGIHLHQLAQHDAAKVRRVVPDGFAQPQALGITVGKAPDHVL